MQSWLGAQGERVALNRHAMRLDGVAQRRGFGGLTRHGTMDDRVTGLQ